VSFLLYASLKILFGKYRLARMHKMPEVAGLFLQESPELFGSFADRSRHRMHVRYPVLFGFLNFWISFGNVSQIWENFCLFFFEFWQSSLAKSDLTISGSYTNRCYYILQFTATWPVMVGELQEGGGSAFIQFKIHTATRCNTLVNLSGWWSCSHEIQETYQQTATHCNKL